MVNRKIRTNFASDRAVPPFDQLQLPLSRDQVLAAERRWGLMRRAQWVSQWHTIETLAGDIWSTPEADVDRLQRLWVLLTYAVGNFKRQGNTTIDPMPPTWRLAPLPGSGDRRPKLSIPTSDALIELFSSGTTEPLREVSRGLASTATGSTLLAALWPDEHAILDMRDLQVTVGLLAANGSPVVAADERASLKRPDWSEYQWFRALIKAESARLELPSLLTLERALFIAYTFIRQGRAVGHLTWGQWGDELLRHWPNR